MPFPALSALSDRRSSGRLPSHLVRVVLAAAGGLVAYLAYPTVDQWYVAPVGVLLLVLATHRVGSTVPRTVIAGALLGAVFATALHLPLIGWTGIFLGWLPRGALTALMAVYGAVCGAGLALASHLTNPVARTLGPACWWVASEAVASRFPFGGFGWSRLAFSQADAPTRGLAALGGVPLVSFAVALTGAALAAGLLSARRARSTAEISRAGTLSGAVAVAITALGLLVPLHAEAQNGTLDTLGVQGNVPRAGLDFNSQRRQVLDWHARATRRAAEERRTKGRPPPELVIWPENASDIDPYRNADAYEVIDDAVTAVAAPTLVGGLVVGEAAPDGEDPRAIENSSILWLPGRGPTTRYVKQLPVPFVEYVPYRRWLVPIIPMLDLAGNMKAGSGVGIFEVPRRLPAGEASSTVPVGALICFEIVSDSVVRETVRGGAQFVALQTNNATFGYSAESEQQLALMRMRAIEHGRTFAQVSTVGVSAFARPDGSVSPMTSLYTAATIEEDVALRTAPTIASRVGAAPEYVMLGGGMLTITAAATRKRRGAARTEELQR